MLESELHDRENNDNAGGGRAAGELNAPAPSVPAAVFQPPQVVFQPPAIRPEPAAASQPSGSSRPAGPPGTGEAAGEGGPDDDRRGPPPQTQAEPQPVQER